jgi:hypothetical protein
LEQIAKRYSYLNLQPFSKLCLFYSIVLCRTVIIRGTDESNGSFDKFNLCAGDPINIFIKRTF